jgi:protoporphyrin/coproporphyrin ferrochelatase
VILATRLAELFRSRYLSGVKPCLGSKPLNEVSPTHSTNHPPVTAGRIGVLIVNLGTPDATDPRSLRRYLREFLTDQRVIEENGLLWKIVLHGFILTVRPRMKGPDYEKIWNREKNESPLKTISRSQSEKLATALAPLGEKVSVDWAMRYGNPSIASRLEALAQAGCDRILIVPLYPQYAAATTATVCDEAFRCLMRMRWQPTVRVAPPYFDDAVYIDALATSLKAALDSLSFRPERILASYHGIPEEYVQKGDPYYRHCDKTTRLLRERLGFDESKLMMTFQSRFGRAEWLKPYTIETVQQLAEGGCKDLLVITPGFSADCLETLEEIAVENATVFKEHGGENFAVVPCLNDSEPGMRVIETLVERELGGWV